MKKDSKVEVQKGKMIGNPPTMKQMVYPERVKERETEMKETRRGQTLDMHEPKRSKK